MATVIDELIVTLGLDPSDFTKGQKTAAKELVSTEKKVKSSASGMEKAITGAARKFALAFLGFASAAGVTRMVSSLNEMERRLGFLSKNTGESVTDLRDWSRAAEVAGGSAEGFLKTIQQIADEQSTFQLKGESNWTGFLRSLGMAPDTLSEAHSKIDVFRELVAKFEELSKLQGGRQRIFTLGKMMNIDDDTLNFMLQGTKKTEAFHAQQTKGFRLTDAEADAAQGTSSRITRLKQHGEDFVTALMAKLRPVVDKWADAIEKWLASIDLNKLATNIDDLITAIAGLSGVIEGLSSILGAIFKWVGTKLGESAGWAATMWGKWGPGGSGRVDNASATRGYKADPALEKLRRAVNSGVSSGKSIGELADTLGLSGDENALIGMMNLMSGATGKSSTQPLSLDDLQKINDAVEQRAILEGRKAGTAGGAAAMPGVAKIGALSSPGTGSNTRNTVNIGRIEIRADEASASGIASGIERELGRRNLISQAETGLA